MNTFSNKVLNFEDALSLVSKIQDKESKSKYINSIAKTILLTHGHKTQRSIILYHGFTNCPKQFEKMGKEIFNIGFNVYIPRLKYHGHKSRLSKAMSKLKTADLISYIHNSIKIAQALGNEVYIIGLSGGGTMALHAAMQYSLKQVILLTPVIDPAFYPKGFRYIVINLIKLLPNRFIWWDSKAKENIDSPKYAYAWFCSKAIVRFFELASNIENQLKFTMPATGNITIILNESDKTAYPYRLKNLINKLKSKKINVKEFIFNKEEGILHDMIDPNQAGEKTDFVYKKIINNLQID